MAINFKLQSLKPLSRLFDIVNDNHFCPNTPCLSTSNKELPTGPTMAFILAKRALTCKPDSLGPNNVGRALFAEEKVQLEAPI